ncbi:MAG: RNA polymerase sigma factor [Imperialibacter sp.]|uniref:RNA polymerase sigma factor n=1 Tax=Imperialibacter sp. TaxID=2038411 RepID=UPI0032EDB88B
MSRPEADEAKLIEKCRKQQPPAQRELYENYFNYAMSVALRYSQGRDEAIEIVNDAFLKTFNSLAYYDQAQGFKKWFRRIVINTAIDHYRKNKKHYQTHDLLYKDQAVDPDVFEKFSAEEIMQCVQRLTPAYRLVFVLYAVEGYKHHEIAEMLQVSEGTSKSNLAAARGKLKNLLIEMFHLNSTRYGG